MKFTSSGGTVVRMRKKCAKALASGGGLTEWRQAGSIAILEAYKVAALDGLNGL
jgi:hypothetical protein